MEGVCYVEEIFEKPKNPESTLLRKTYRFFKPHYPWLLVDYSYEG